MQRMGLSMTEIKKAVKEVLSRFYSKERFKPVFKRTGRLLLVVVSILCIVTVLEVVVFRFLDSPVTVRVACSSLYHRVAGKHYKESLCHWRRLEEISPHLKRAVLASEDQKFLSHHGFDFAELNRAFRELLGDERIRGASTISMQVARTVFLWSGRSWLRKIVEAYYTVLIELIWSKEKIFEVYLNTVHWGKGIMGAEAASWVYFHTSSATLTASQAALLAAILPNPTKWAPVNPSAYIRERQQEIMEQMAGMPVL
jgi:monofunctional biosynthetic peptidoglycan transglycosylase